MPGACCQPGVTASRRCPTSHGDGPCRAHVLAVPRAAQPVMMSYGWKAALNRSVRASSSALLDSQAFQSALCTKRGGGVGVWGLGGGSQVWPHAGNARSGLDSTSQGSTAAHCLCWAPPHHPPPHACQRCASVATRASRQTAPLLPGTNMHHLASSLGEPPTSAAHPPAAPAPRAQS